MILAVVLSLTTGCGTHPNPNFVDSDVVEPQKLQPGSYLGDLPCADCEGIRYRLDLFEDQVFYLSMEYLGQAEDQFHDDIGIWSIKADSPALSLEGGREAPLFFRISGDDALEKLDQNGQEIASDLNYQLQLISDLPPIEPRLFMRGMYSYMADAALFTECLTGRRFAVAFEADSISLEKAYLKAQSVPGQAILVNVEGQIAQRPAMEGDRTEQSLVVDRFIGIWPGQACDQPQRGKSETRKPFGRSQ